MTTNDAEHLRALAVCHYIFAAFHLASLLLFMLFLGLGWSLASGALRDIVMPGGPGNRGPLGLDFSEGQDVGQGIESIEYILAAVGVIVLLVSLSAAFLTFLAGRFLARRQSHLFCTIIAALECLQFPLGTALGVVTIVVLQRPTVRQLFAVSGQEGGAI